MHKADGVCVLVLLFIHCYKAAGDAAVFIALLPKFFIEALLSNKFIEAVVSIIVTYQEDLPDVLRYRGQAVGRGCIGPYGCLPIITAIGKHGRIFVHTGFFSSFSFSRAMKAVGIFTMDAGLKYRFLSTFR